MNPLLNTPEKIWLNCINISVQTNPCPCGYYGDKEHICECTLSQIRHYTQKLSGPLLDRVDIQIQVPRVSYQELTAVKKAETSAQIRQRVMAARERQLYRFQKMDIVSNGQLTHSMLGQYCPMTAEAQQLLEAAFHQRQMSARSYDRLVKVARTIGDLAGKDTITAEYIGEALLMRNDNIARAL